MRLKETTSEQRLITLFIMAMFVGYGMLLIRDIDLKFIGLCEMSESPIVEQAWVLRFFVLLAAAGAGLISLHIWPVPNKKDK